MALCIWYEQSQPIPTLSLTHIITTHLAAVHNPATTLNCIVSRPVTHMNRYFNSDIVMYYWSDQVTASIVV